MSRFTCAASEINIFQKLKKFLFGGAIFMILNMMYHSLQFPVTKNLERISSSPPADTKRVDQFASNASRTDDQVGHEGLDRFYSNASLERWKDGARVSRPEDYKNQLNSNVPRTRTKLIEVGQGEKREVVIETPLFAAQFPHKGSRDQGSDLQGRYSSFQSSQDRRGQGRPQSLQAASSAKEQTAVNRPLVAGRPPVKRPKDTEELPVIERQLMIRGPLPQRRQSFMERARAPQRPPLVKAHRKTSPTGDPPVDGQQDAFKPRVSGRDFRILERIVDTFSAAMRRAGVEFFLYSGSLLGSWRHHGLVPWDDDVDFAVPRLHQQQVYRVLSDLRPRFLLEVRQKVRWKFFSDLSHPIRQVTWSWPFVDISFYLENATHVWDQDGFFPAFSFPKADIFPLQGRPFMGRLLPAPRDTEAVLQRTYNLSLCKVGSYNHHTESYNDLQDMRSVSCSTLSNVFPFVRRGAAVGRTGCNETLVRNGAVVSWFLAPPVACRR